MRTARDQESAVRAEALLREIVDYEMRHDSDAAEIPAAHDSSDDYSNLQRRWSDVDDH